MGGLRWPVVNLPYSKALTLTDMFRTPPQTVRLSQLSDE